LILAYVVDVRLSSKSGGKSDIAAGPGWADFVAKVGFEVVLTFSAGL